MEIIQQGKKLVICTHAAKGATTLLPTGEWIEVPALSYNIVDTNGAGDNFFIGFLYGYLHGFAIKKSLQIATIMGGLAITSKELVDMELSEEKVMKEYRKWFL